MQGKGMIVQVQDGMMGYYGHKRRYGKSTDRPKGDIFRIKGPHTQIKTDRYGNTKKVEANDFSDRWMTEIVGARLKPATDAVKEVEAEEKAAEEAQAEQSEEITEDDLVIGEATTEEDNEPEIELEAPKVTKKKSKKGKK